MPKTNITLYVNYTEINKNQKEGYIPNMGQGARKLNIGIGQSIIECLHMVPGVWEVV